MEPFVERMVKDYDELNDRVNKLGVFIETEKYMSLPLEEQRDQVLQYHAMVIYRMALANRLKRQGVDTSADAI